MQWQTRNNDGQCDSAMRTVRTGKTVDVTLRITAKDLWTFSMYHANAGFMGMFNLGSFPWRLCIF